MSTSMWQCVGVHWCVVGEMVRTCFTGAGGVVLWDGSVAWRVTCVCECVCESESENECVCVRERERESVCV